MKKIWYLPIVVVVGAASLTVWGQANAGPPPSVSPGVVVDLSSGSAPATAEDSRSLPPSPSPSPTATAGTTAAPGHEAPETEHIPAELHTYPSEKASDDGPAHDLFDDKGGLRADNASDDGPSHDLYDDKGGGR
ncbi:hypothetical protein [Arthrobacter cavernae]|uniref:Uncharacterized protein n=1 Tax=Arthrobacter cavernae TaxID=2817681 RepID=A0A939HKQ0_9MICC|nr:hypothetical protein [Arthrobacter cavernae]MBO1269165.1 hypothetical protein [Arthrobacter cavernae]